MNKKRVNTQKENNMLRKIGDDCFSPEGYKKAIATFKNNLWIPERIAYERKRKKKDADEDA